ncbi:class I adenylate-forming enzyme family protein [Paenibacillus sp. NPDC056579]|uniref:class I adenylate-forming enzyme family protein n=1 Tax=Paenibacillus sp. NPDC056579 TaxID=3345871 RepID=UPI0036A8B20B
MSLFWIDEAQGIKKSYADLIADMNAKSGCRRCIFYDNPYHIFLELVHSMAYGIGVEMLDSNFSESERSRLGVSPSMLVSETETGGRPIADFEELCTRIDAAKERWSVTIYTSGTTGRPKKVTHSLSTIARSVKQGPRYKDNVWAFSFNPTHFAGLQVFFQAFFNRNPMLYIFDTDKNEVHSLLLKYGVTNISATPTFYRTLLPLMEHPLPDVRIVTVGGEKFDSNVLKDLGRVMPHAKIRNVYASTEAGSLFGSVGEIFEINESLRPFVKISDDRELLIHKSLLGAAEEVSLADGDWYHTGDTVTLLDEHRFVFAARKTEMINIGGYKVNPHEVEEQIKTVDGVLDVLVKSRHNRITGNILVADIVKASGYDEQQLEDSIRNILVSTLQAWKIPRLFHFVNELPKSRTGKKVRT